MAATIAPKSVADSLDELKAISAELFDLTRIAELLGWDQETMMPSKGVPFRAAQQATLQGIHHERLTSPRVGELLKRLEEPARDERAGLNDVDRAIVREMRRSYDRAVKLPGDLVKELARATSEAVDTWQKARAASDFAAFRGDLERVMGLKRKAAEHIGYRTEPYDALIDEYEPGATAAQLEALFKQLRSDTVALLDKIRAAPIQPDRSILEREYDVDTQWRFGEEVLRWIGFDFEAGRQDKSAHPFCSSFGSTDVRLTTRLSERDLGQALFGSMHEGGHGLYELGIGAPVQRSVIGTGVSLGVHESQSRLWENCVGRGRPFWEFALPRLKEHFPEQLKGVDAETFWRAANRVEPSFIRVEADEVTYNLHIILRFEIERRLFKGEIDVGDLPTAWNESMTRLLGVTPPDDAKGVLQDIHWAFGLVGYFPTYTLGNVYGAQLWAAIGRDIPDRDARIARGDFAVILSWLRERIHQYGGTYLPTELIQRATGEAPDARYLTRYLNEKYAAVYGFAAG
jgi:carboxypeptidase Taq